VVNPDRYSTVRYGVFSGYEVFCPSNLGMGGASSWERGMAKKERCIAKNER